MGPSGDAPALDGADPLLVSILMGYGHQRAAYALADGFGVDVLRIDAPPLAEPDEVRVWDRSRWIYETCSRVYRRPLVGALPRRFLDALTSIRPSRPRGPDRNVRPTRQVRFQAKLLRHGQARGLVRAMRETGRAMVTTFYTPGLAADRAGLDGAYVVVTDNDVHRVWAPPDTRGTGIHYLAPSPRAHDRLRSYGVPEDRVTLTGFPLPPELTADDEVLRRHVAGRVVRLDPEHTIGEADLEGADGLSLPEAERGRPPHLVVAVGGAGAQADLADQLLLALGSLVKEDGLRLTLVAGTRREVAEVFERDIARSSLSGHRGVRVLCEADFGTYYRAFNRALADADVLWTKPSELVFYAGLGMPLILAPPVGAHERGNPPFVLGAGAGVRQEPPAEAGRWLPEWIRSGRLARCALAAHRNLPHDGTRRIVEAVRRGEAARAGP